MALRALQGPTGGGAPVGGTGTTNTIPRWTGASTLGDSGLIDDGSTITSSRLLVSQRAGGAVANTEFIKLFNQSFVNQSNVTIGMYVANNTVATGAISHLYNSAGATYDTTFSLWNGSALGEAMRIKQGGNVGVGTTSPAARVHSVAADGTYQLALAGTTKGIRFQTTAAQSQIDGVDSTLVGSYQPLAINGSTLGFLIGGVTKAGINGSSQLYVSTNGTAASPVICESTGVSGMYFPSAATVAIAANGAIAATFSKVAGAGVALGGTTGLVFDASGSQQGIKLRATPDSTDTQTLDCYQEGTWTPTLAGFGGTTPTVTANYTRVGRLVTVHVKITPTGGAAWSAAGGGAVAISLPAGIVPASDSSLGAGVVFDSNLFRIGDAWTWTNNNMYLSSIASTTATAYFSLTYRTV